MTVREEVLACLTAREGAAVSGEELARSLGVTRAAVWKAIRSLTDEGYAIDASPRRGYTLSATSDVLTEDAVRRYLAPSCPVARLVVETETTSTNDDARRAASAGAPHGTVIAAGMQTAGRGRRGRSFLSPPGTGLYVSVVLRPTLPAAEAIRLTTAAAVAAARAAERLTPCEAQIKWVNDVFVRGRKVCGILTEAAFAAETDQLDYAVVGIGINVTEPEGGFPPELSGVAGALLSGRTRDARARLLAALLEELFSLYGSLADGGYIDEYRRRCFVIGRRVRVICAAGAEEYEADAVGVDDECRLLVRTPGGGIAALSSGEISVRVT